jgi:hypothetical protein
VGAFALWYLTRRWANWFDRFAVLFAYGFVAVAAPATRKIAIRISGGQRGGQEESR